jgi:hypothetical protein
MDCSAPLDVPPGARRSYTHIIPCPPEQFGVETLFFGPADILCSSNMGVNTSLRGFACAQKCGLLVDAASLTAIAITIVLAMTLPENPKATGGRS